MEIEKKSLANLYMDTKNDSSCKEGSLDFSSLLIIDLIVNAEAQAIIKKNFLLGIENSRIQVNNIKI
ncbi:hypothetical protein [Alkalicoccobacillus porphyridii]|uniref:Uncharacterized protein n=1 Tax=Alkalicoccobacillus porphyridii TaxID=2597270 RepID=A0A553ZWM4_9BACI|nr:hypothetical protein [Alkalicoccobacillus porphyridii]TSB45864.1 hypothetical protein FN960_13170 [Alkalicoccobacillus porphyridii]